MIYDSYFSDLARGLATWAMEENRRRKQLAILRVADRIEMVHRKQREINIAPGTPGAMVGGCWVMARSPMPQRQGRTP